MLSNDWTPNERAVTNPKNNSVYLMIPAAQLDATDKQLSNLVSICNQESIYNFLFRERLKGRPYGVEDARGFLSWAKRGWQEQTHFVFLLVTQSGMIAAALDVKSHERSMAEVGYWCSELHRGATGKAVGELKVMAREAGFAALFARVRKDNPASIRVLERNGFISKGDWPGDDSRLRYELMLEA